MKTFMVYVQREVYDVETRSIEVEAPTQAEAEAIALARAKGIDGDTGDFWWDAKVSPNGTEEPTIQGGTFEVTR